MPRRSVPVRELRTIRTSFAQLAKSFARLEPFLAAAASGSGNRVGPVTGRPRRKLRLTPQRKRDLKLQGEYMGTMRGLSPKVRSKIKKIRADKGIQAAIRAAKKLAS